MEGERERERKRAEKPLFCARISTEIEKPMLETKQLLLFSLLLCQKEPPFASRSFVFRAPTDDEEGEVLPQASSQEKKKRKRASAAERGREKRRISSRPL